MSDVAAYLPMFNWQIGVSNLIEVIIIGVASITFLNKMNASISLLRKDISYIQASQLALNEAFKQLGTILTQVAVQDTRLSMIEKRVDDMAHGRGFIGKD